MLRAKYFTYGLVNAITHHVVTHTAPGINIQFVKSAANHTQDCCTKNRYISPTVFSLSLTVQELGVTPLLSLPMETLRISAPL